MGIQLAQVLGFLTIHCSEHLMACLNECENEVRRKISVSIDIENNGRGGRVISWRAECHMVITAWDPPLLADPN